MPRFWSILKCILIMSIAVLLGINVKAKASSDSAKVLVAYYSRTGNTEKIANQIHNIVGGDMLKIETVKAYPSSHDSILTQVRNELYSGYLPPLSTVVENIDKYDLIFVGHPIWWGHMPPPVKTFVSSYNFSGKKIAHFCTYSNDGIALSRNDLLRFCPNSIILESLAVLGSSADNAGSTVKSWLDSIGVLTEDDTSKTKPIQVLISPAHDYLSITGNFKFLTMFNINGMKIIQTSEKTINISSLPTGFYLLRIESSDSRRITEKIIK